MNETSISNTGNPHSVLVTTARQLMEDVAEWWIRVLLRDFNVDHFQSCLETVLPHVSPLAADSPLASQFRLLSLWEEVLVNTHLQGDFAMLRDKLLLLSTQFTKTSEYDNCMDLLKVHEVLGRLHTSLSNNMISESAANAALDRYRFSLAGIFVGKQIPDELSTVMHANVWSDTPSVLNHLETLVSSNTGSAKYGYDTLRDQIQALLWNWVECGFPTPILVRLGYRQNDPSGQMHETNTERNKAATTRASTTAQETTYASEDDEDSDHSNENHEEGTATSRAQVSPILLSNTEQQRLTEQGLQDSEAPEIVPAEPKSTFVGKKQSLVDESDSDDDPEVWSARQRHARKILAPFSSRHFLKSNSEHVNKKRLQRQKLTQSASELLAVVQSTSSQRHRRRQSDPLSQRAELARISSSGRTRNINQLRALISPPRTNPIKKQQPDIPSVVTTGTKTRVSSIRRKDGTKSRLAPLATRKPLVGRKRRPFSREESLAVKNGVLKFGGDWALIKTHFKDILASRSLIHIKDHARILIIKGKLDPGSLKFYGEEDVVLVDV